MRVFLCITSTAAQERTRHGYDRLEVLERDESIRSMKLHLDFYGSTGEQAVLGAWVLLESNIAPPQFPPAADPNPRPMSRSGRLRIHYPVQAMFAIWYRHCHLMRLFVVSVQCT